jgi:hypothetical protein
MLQQFSMLRTGKGLAEFGSSMYVLHCQTLSY